MQCVFLSFSKYQIDLAVNTLYGQSVCALKLPLVLLFAIHSEPQLMQNSPAVSLCVSISLLMNLPERELLSMTSISDGVKLNIDVTSFLIS